MIKVYMFLGLALSIAKANGWLVVPGYCIAFCWIVSIVGCFIYFWAKGLIDEAVDRMEKMKKP